MATLTKNSFNDNSLHVTRFIWPALAEGDDVIYDVSGAQFIDSPQFGPLIWSRTGQTLPK